MTHSLIVDLGTTYFKAVLFDADGRSVATARRPTPIKHPRPDRSEITIPAFESALLALCDELCDASPDAYADVRDVSFSTQANTFALFDAEGEALTPFVVWTDDRARETVLPDFNDYALTGIPTMGHRFAVSKLRWFAQHQPDLWRRADRLMFLSDYFTFWLTGERITEAGVAGLSGLLDIHRIAWRADAVTALGLETLKLPEPRRAGTRVGPLLPGTGDALHLSRDCVFTLGCLDQYAGALAAGVLDDDGACETTGTVLATVRAASTFDPSLADHGVFQGPTPTPDRYYRMVFGDTSANLLAAYRRHHAPDLTYEALDALAAALPDSERAVRLGHVTADLTTLTFNATLDGRRVTPSHAQAVDAIYRRVAEALRDQLATLCRDGKPSRLVSLGGGARSATWRAIKTHLTGLPSRTLPTDEPTAWGVWRLMRETG